MNAIIRNFLLYFIFSFVFTSCKLNEEPTFEDELEKKAEEFFKEMPAYINLMAIPNKEKVGVNKLFKTTIILTDEPEGEIKVVANNDVDSIRIISDTIYVFNTPKNRADNSISVTVSDNVNGVAVKEQVVEMTYAVVPIEVELSSIDNKPFELYKEKQLVIEIDDDSIVRYQLSVTGGSVIENKGNWFLTPGSREGVTITVTGFKAEGQKLHLETFAILVK